MPLFPESPAIKVTRSLYALPAATVLLITGAYAQSFGESLLLEGAPANLVDIEFDDIDGDGDPDLVLSTSVRGLIQWQPNVGGGFFGPARTVHLDNSGFSSFSVSAGDLDGDGDVDLMSTSFQSPTMGAVRTYENLGSGSFGPAQTISGTPSSAMNGSLTDLDGDGQLDLLFLSGNMRIYWCRNLGSGSFSAAAVVVVTTSETNDVQHADLDGDGDQDVVFMASLASSIFWSENLGGGNFGPKQGLTNQIFNPRDLDIVDMDGDGDLDLLSLSTQNRYVAWVENLGSVQFGPRQVIAVGVGSDGPRQTSAGDLDGDGDTDVVVAWQGASGLAWYEGTGGGAFGLANPISPVGSYPEFLELVDLDQDGDLDPFLARGGMEWAENQGMGTFAAPSPVAVSTRGLVGFVTADLDDDGDLDLVAGHPIENEILSITNAGGGRFQGGATLASGLELTSSVQAADLDGDGDLDLVSGSGSYDSIRAAANWHENLGSGSFAPPVEIYADLADSGATVSLADFDGDGDPDVLVQYLAGFTSTRQQVAWVRNDGLGSFVELPSKVLGRSGPARAVDVDGDSDLDLVALVVSGAGGTLFSYENTNGVLADGQAVQAYSQVQPAFAVGDLDGDGAHDLLVLDSAGPKIDFFAGTIGPGFSAPTTLVTLPAAAADIVMLDLDADGDEEPVVFSQDEATWFENLGAGGVGVGQPIANWSTLSASGSLGAADLDGDLDADLYRNTFYGLIVQSNELYHGAAYCLPGTLNSTGLAARITSAGSPSVAANGFTLIATDMPAGQFGFFVVADAPGFLVSPGGSQGNLCVGGAIGRIARNAAEIFLSDAGGTAAISLDLTDVPTPSGPESVMAGDTRFFQAWFRDVNPGAASNLTSGLRVTFVP